MAEHTHHEQEHPHVHHCPYLGLKRNRNKQLTFPSADHRCYVSHQALEIPVNQAENCLSSTYYRCPLYMEPEEEIPASGLGGVMSRLPASERTFYISIAVTLLVVVSIYIATEFSGLAAVLPSDAEAGGGVTATVEASPQPTSDSTGAIEATPATGSVEATPTAAPSSSGAPTAPFATFSDGAAVAKAGMNPAITALRGVEDGQTVSGPLTVNVDVAGEQITEVVFQIDGPKLFAHSEKTAPYFFPGDVDGAPLIWDTTAYPDGDYTMTVVATDTAGQQAEKTVRFRIGNVVK
jgi:hypothetical protein